MMKFVMEFGVILLLLVCISNAGLNVTSATSESNNISMNVFPVSNYQFEFIRFAQRVTEIMSYWSSEPDLFAEEVENDNNNNNHYNDNILIDPKKNAQFQYENQGLYNKFSDSHLVSNNYQTVNSSLTSISILYSFVNFFRIVSTDFNMKLQNIITAAEYVINDNNSNLHHRLFNTTNTTNNITKKEVCTLEYNDINGNSKVAGDKLKCQQEMLRFQEGYSANHSGDFRTCNLAREHCGNMNVCENTNVYSAFSINETKGNSKYDEINASREQELVETLSEHAFTLAKDEEEDRSLVSPITNRVYDCSNGYTIVSESLRYNCGWYHSDIDVYTYLSLPSWQRKYCVMIIDSKHNSTDDSSRISCLCSLDKYAFVQASHEVSCEARSLALHPYLSSPFIPCSGTNGPNEEVSDFCLTTSRNNSLQLPVIWSYRWLNDTEMNLSVADDKSYVLPFDYNIAEQTNWVIVSDVFIKQDSYNGLQSDWTLFDYYYSPMLPNGQIGFGITHENDWLADFEFFTAPVSFTHPELINSRMIVVPKNSFSSKWEYVDYIVNTYLANPEGHTTNSVALSPSEYEDEFINGGELYVESGVHGPGMLNKYAVLRLHISFNNTSPPVKRYNHKSNRLPSYMVLVFFVIVVAVVLLAAVIVDYCLNKGEIPDDLVSRAQHNQAKKTNTVKVKE